MLHFDFVFQEAPNFRRARRPHSLRPWPFARNRTEFLWNRCRFAKRLGMAPPYRKDRLRVKCCGEKTSDSEIQADFAGRQVPASRPIRFFWPTAWAEEAFRVLPSQEVADAFSEWAHLGLNQGPPRCERGALPLSYAPFAPSGRIGRPWCRAAAGRVSSAPLCGPSYIPCRVQYTVTKGNKS